jgi:hypothetical protein
VHSRTIAPACGGEPAPGSPRQRRAGTRAAVSRARVSAAASGLTAKDALLTGLGENLDLKDDNPGMAPVNGWLAWRAANGEEDPRP